MFFYPRYLRNGDCTYNGEFDQVYIRRCNSLVLMFWSWFQFLFSYFYLGLRQGHEKLRELEEITSGQGIFNEDFSLGLGDFLEIPDGDGNGGNSSAGNGSEPPALPNQIPDETKKTKQEPFPTLESGLKASELVSRYKKSLLSRQAAFKDIHQKWLESSPPTGKMLAFHVRVYLLNFVFAYVFFFRVAARLCFLTCDISASGTNGMHCQQLLVPWANFFGTNDFFQLRIFFSVPIFFGGPIRWNVKVQVRCLSSTDLFVQRSKNK